MSTTTRLISAPSRPRAGSTRGPSLRIRSLSTQCTKGTPFGRKEPAHAHSIDHSVQGVQKSSLLDGKSLLIAHAHCIGHWVHRVQKSPLLGGKSLRNAHALSTVSTQCTRVTLRTNGTAQCTCRRPCLMFINMEEVGNFHLKIRTQDACAKGKKRQIYF
jgi:hypothetical protein